MKKVWHCLVDQWPTSSPFRKFLTLTVIIFITISPRLAAYSFKLSGCGSTVSCVMLAAKIAEVSSFNMGFELDTSSFKESIRFVLDNTHKKLPDVINRAALATIIGGKGVQGAMQRTPKAAREKILAVPREVIARVVMAKVNQGQFYLPLRGFRGAGAGPGGSGARRAEINRLIRKEYSKRLAAIGYTANVGWNNAAKAFGGRGIGGRATGLGEAALGEGRPATPGNLVAQFSNAAPAAYLIGQQALQDALDQVSDDMIAHTKEILQKIFDESHKG